MIFEKDNEDEIFDSCALDCFDVGFSGLYSYCLLVILKSFREVFADQQIEIRRFELKVKVDGVDGSGTDRILTCQKVGRLLWYSMTSAPIQSDMVYSYGPQAFDDFLRFLERRKEKTMLLTRQLCNFKTALCMRQNQGLKIV